MQGIVRLCHLLVPVIVPTHPADTPKQYWKVSLYYAFIDHMILELESRLIKSENRFYAQYLLPRVIGNITNEGYSTGFTASSVSQSEVDIWWRGAILQRVRHRATSLLNSFKLHVRSVWYDESVWNELYQSALDLSEPFDIVENMPRRCGRQTTRDNPPADTPKQYRNNSMTVLHSFVASSRSHSIPCRNFDRNTLLCKMCSDATRAITHTNLDFIQMALRPYH
jgi:hypothetical protein